MGLALVTNLSFTNFLTTSLFITLLNLLISTGTVFNLLLYNLSASNFKVGELAFLAKFDVSTLIAFLNLVLLHN